MDAILDSLDSHGKKAAFENNFAKLEASPRIDFNVLKICVRLIEPIKCSTDRSSDASFTALQHERLWIVLESRIFLEEDLDHLYKIAQTCLSHAVLALYVEEQIYCKLTQLHQDLDDHVSRHEDHVQSVIPLLRFLMCSFWLPKDQIHIVNCTTIGLLSGFIGIDVLDSAAHDALSALFSLFKTDGQLLTVRETQSSEAINDPAFRLDGPLLDETLWFRLKNLPPRYFTSNTSKIFRTWFQWISQVVLDGIEVSCIYDGLYWDRLRMGLVNGFADQRKYCLGIIHQSLRAARKDICTTFMQYRITERNLYLKAYQNFETLFETIVLNRYIKQVEACLPELTVLFGTSSIITPSMVVAMLTAALDPKIQEGIRKIIGNWYIKSVINVS